MRLLVLLCFALAALAQQEMKIDVAKFRYPTLAKSARIQGDVILEVSGAERKRVSGNPLLTGAAEMNLATWNVPLLESSRYLIHYHFQLLDIEIRQQTVLIGNRFERVFLRLFKAPTTKTVTSCYSDPTPEPPTRYTTRKESSDYVIDVFVSGHAPCISTLPSENVARSHL